MLQGNSWTLTRAVQADPGRETFERRLVYLTDQHASGEYGIIRMLHGQRIGLYS